MLKDSIASFSNQNHWPSLISDIEVRDYLDIQSDEGFLAVLKPEGKFRLIVWIDDVSSLLLTVNVC